jgi:hypothetical protein
MIVAHPDTERTVIPQAAAAVSRREKAFAVVVSMDPP